MEKIIILILFAIFLIAAIIPRIIQKRKKLETVGCISINRKLFFLGKISLFSSFLLILVQIFLVNLSIFGQDDIFLWISVGFLSIGVLFFTLAIITLGTFSLRVGARPRKNRPPHHWNISCKSKSHVFGLYLMAIGSAIYVQNPVNWILIIIALTIHHKIILVEEKFLLSRFGEEWTEYRSKVHRYV